MKSLHTSFQRAAGRLMALLLTVVLTAGCIPAANAVGTVHFTDVPASHWAYPYVERAYQDGAIVGTGGDPAVGQGTFSPDSQMTFGEFFAMLVKAFYQDELGGASKDGPWYAPAIQIAVNHALTFLSEEELMETRAVQPINRYHAAYIIVKLMQDKGAVLPSQQERDAAAAKISDWSSVSDSTWAYYVSSIYALGIISGVDSAGTFSGSGYITRGAAAVIYTRLADKLPQFSITKGEGWELIPDPAYWEKLEEVFSTVYPRLWARWGGGIVSKTVSVNVRDELPDAIMWASWTYGEDGAYEPYVEISAKYQDIPASYSLPHELGHVVQTYYYNDVWWDECMADYARFRYYVWADMENLQLADRFFYQPDEQALRNWSFESYTDSLWFFAYMDAKYPTTPQGYGLIDSIHYGFLTGEIASDSINDPTLNAVVQRITGYSTIEQLRQQYVRELDAGTWTFNGFAGYSDNYITENLPGVPNPSYPTMENINLCTGSYTYAVSGEASPQTAGDYLVDGDLSTRWEAAKKDITDQSTYHNLCISLGKTLTFDTYTLYHAGSQGDSRQNTVSWRLKYYDSQTDAWKLWDEVTDSSEDVTTRTVTPVTTKWLWLEILNPSETGDGTVRLYELELYDRR